MPAEDICKIFPDELEAPWLSAILVIVTVPSPEVLYECTLLLP